MRSDWIVQEFSLEKKQLKKVMKEVLQNQECCHKEDKEGTAVSLFPQSQQLEWNSSEAMKPGTALEVSPHAVAVHFVDAEICRLQGEAEGIHRSWGTKDTEAVSAKPVPKLNRV